jgi:hypothetical protein
VIAAVINDIGLIDLINARLMANAQEGRYQLVAYRQDQRA